MDRCELIVEQCLTLAVKGIGNYMLMCTPCDTRALAVGFLYSENLIGGIDDILLMHHCEDDDAAIEIRLSAGPGDLPEVRNLIVPSSCGMCGSYDIDALLSDLKPVGESMHVSHPTLIGVANAMHARQKLFSRTGAAHAAAVFDDNGEIKAFAEDIGRHNALDKVIGKSLLGGKTTTGCGVMLSGRVSFDMALKAANAGIELMAAVSAPSSLAAETARHCGITLCGFVRGERLTAYVNPDRIS